jgi:Fe-S-cluster-containing dehydrogenase component
MDNIKISRSDEFKPGSHEWVMDSGVDRRNFLGIMGASLAMAGMAGGCIRKPVEKILPYSRRPEEIVEGKPLYYASAILSGKTVQGILVETHEGRPTKIEGNPDHPGSLGAANTWTQARILEMYDPDRGQGFKNNKDIKAILREDFEGFLKSQKDFYGTNKGKGLAFLFQETNSLTLHWLLAQIQQSFPEAKLYKHNALDNTSKHLALKKLGVDADFVTHDLSKARVIVSVGSDFMGTELDNVANARGFAKTRRLPNDSNANPDMSRFYAFESHYSISGSLADNRKLLSPSQLPEALTHLANALLEAGLSLPPQVVAKLRETGFSPATDKNWYSALAKDLMANRGRSIILVGEFLPGWVHVLAMAINESLNGDEPNIVEYRTLESGLSFGTIADLANDASRSAISSLFIFDGNPVYSSPVDLVLESVISQIQYSVYNGLMPNETSALVGTYVAQPHSLESWGDLVSTTGVAAIVQPMIAPLFESMTREEILAGFTSHAGKSSYDLVRSAFFEKSPTDFERNWKRWLHDGLTSIVSTKSLDSINFSEFVSIAQGAGSAAMADLSSLDLYIVPSNTVMDGRFSNISWLQELPDVFSKVTWENVAMVSPSTGKELKLSNGDMIEISLEGKSVEVPVKIVLGTAPNAVVLPMGYGLKWGSVAKGLGTNAFELLFSKIGHIAQGAKITRTSRTTKLAIMQGHDSMEGRPIVREATLLGYTQDPNFAEKGEMIKKDHQKTLLWTDPHPRSGNQWGMTIDLNTCTGCNACTIACQAENSIPVVGKKEVLNGRELAWIRIDRYFNGSIDDPEVVTQPMNCQHCENAPCESVCPVGATIHSPEGLNDMAYNRCIGTRYCANNCPYKVRRFNYFNYSKINDESNPLYAMQKNPNITVRFRGVIEKCSLCVQRINRAKIDAKIAGSDFIKDGTILTACQQTCPTGAIEFGNINDAGSAVSKNKKSPRNYGILGELNTAPRVTYLAKVRNPNPEMVK